MISITGCLPFFTIKSVLIFISGFTYLRSEAISASEEKRSAEDINLAVLRISVFFCITDSRISE